VQFALLTVELCAIFSRSHPKELHTNYVQEHNSYLQTDAVRLSVLLCNKRLHRLLGFREIRQRGYLHRLVASKCGFGYRMAV
jgi:hypothetical protein